LFFHPFAEALEHTHCCEPNARNFQPEIIRPNILHAHFCTTSGLHYGAEAQSATNIVEASNGFNFIPPHFLLTDLDWGYL
jgi:hypothetical protein